ncbi:MAG: exo-alpha-sialidase [Planctomycetota bacterium]
MTERTWEGPLTAFLGDPVFERTLAFAEGRQHVIAITASGAVIMPDIKGNLHRSTDNGQTWQVVESEHEIKGTPVLNETTGEMLLLGIAGHCDPVDPDARLDYSDGFNLPLLKSSDDGRSWQRKTGVLHLDENGWLPRLINDKGITLRHGDKAGRLLVPARVHVGYTNKGRGRRFFDKHYNTAAWSDDGGVTWWPSAPFPQNGTGEGTLAELSDGTIYYNSRCHIAADARRREAWSDDGGETWRDLRVSVLPDRSGGHDGQNQAYGCKGGLVRLPVEGRDILLYSHPDIPIEHHRRENVTVWMSVDGGAHWPIKRSVYEGPGGYSMLEAGRPGTPTEGTIHMTFRDYHDRLQHYARFNLAWILEGEATGDGELPDWVAR